MKAIFARTTRCHQSETSAKWPRKMVPVASIRKSELETSDSGKLKRRARTLRVNRA